MAKKTKTYGINNPLQDVFPAPIISKRQPTARDVREYDIGQIWVDKLTSQVYALSSIAGGSALWVLLSPGNSEVDTMTADSGGARSPTNGNMNLSGGANITTSGTSDTITFNLDDAITLETSVSSPTFTTADEIKGMTIFGNRIDADGTASDIPITLNPKGTGDVVIDADNLSLPNEKSSLNIHGGADTDFIGQTVLDDGVKVIANTNITNSDRIFVNRSSIGLSTALGVIEVAVTGGTNFTINSLKTNDPTSIETGDQSIVSYFIVRQL